MAKDSYGMVEVLASKGDFVITPSDWYFEIHDLTPNGWDIMSAATNLHYLSLFRTAKEYENG